VLGERHLSLRASSQILRKPSTDLLLRLRGLNLLRLVAAVAVVVAAAVEVLRLGCLDSGGG